MISLRSTRGDTYAYDSAGNDTKRERELKAAERIFHLLPEDQAADVRGLWDEFEEGKTPEARFAINSGNECSSTLRGRELE